MPELLHGSYIHLMPPAILFTSANWEIARNASLFWHSLFTGHLRRSGCKHIPSSSHMLFNHTRRECGHQTEDRPRRWQVSKGCIAHPTSLSPAPGYCLKQKILWLVWSCYERSYSFSNRSNKITGFSECIGQLPQFSCPCCQDSWNICICM